MKTKKAFTMLELMICVIISGIFVVLFFIQQRNIDAMKRDERRKTAINAMYYALEEGYYAQKGYYPERIESPETLPWIDPNLFTDTNGYNIWAKGVDCEYVYEPANCENGQCQEYVLRSRMEKEEEFVKNSRN
ncbi:type II secretion system protein [Candidatus Saccharibacteria bacterium]|nr:type II secretion system protein [Candidatus Saccharibacteria bacterium]